MNKAVEEVCLIGQGAKCCRYLLMGSKGFECAKNTDFKSILDDRVADNAMVAQGDNCDGREDLHE